MSTKRTGTVDDLVAEFQRETVREHTDRLRNGTPAPAVDPDDPNAPHLVEAPPAYVDPGPIDDEESIATAFANVEEGKGYYVKIFKLSPIPREYGTVPPLMHAVAQPHLVADWDVELHALARQFGWTDGLYAVRLYRDRVPGKIGERRITICVPPPDRAAGIPSGGISVTGVASTTAPPVNPFTQLADTAKLIKQLTEASGSPGANTEAITKAVHEAYRQGVEAAQRGARVDPVAANTGLADVLKALQAFMPKPSTGLEILPTLQAAGLLRPAGGNDDFLDKLIRLREAGLIPKGDSSEGNTVQKTLDMMASLVPLLQTLGGGDGKPASAITEIIRVVGPQVGKVVEDVTTTINKALDTRRLGPPPAPRLVTPPMTVIGGPPNPVPPTSPPIARSPAPASPGPEPPSAPGGDPAMLPILATLRDMIARNNTDDFPAIRDWILQYGRDETYEALVAGTFTYDQLIAYLTPWGGAFLAQPYARAYFDAFLAWTRSQVADEVAVGCPACEEEFVFPSEAALLAEPLCPDCRQPLVRLPVPSASSSPDAAATGPVSV